MQKFQAVDKNLLIDIWKIVAIQERTHKYVLFISHCFHQNTNHLDYKSHGYDLQHFFPAGHLNHLQYDFANKCQQ